jgi:hypothetical protein
VTAAAPTVILSGAVRRQQAHRLVAAAPAGSIVRIETPRRSIPQNDRLHAMITDVSRQVPWHGAKRNVEAWKDIFTAALRSANHGLDVVPGLNGGFVLLGMHTSKMSKTEMGDLMTFIEAWGAENGVIFRDEPEQALAA